MKLQLTKTKTIELTLPKCFSGGSSLYDVTGIELGETNERGCPAVRLSRRGDTWHLVAADFVPPPPQPMPNSWDELKANSAVWSLPSAFQAPAAAIAVSSPMQTARQTTIESIIGEFADDADGKKGEPVPKVEPGVPVSHGGMRFVVEPLAESSFVLQAALPEYQTIWFTRLMPEGRRPTVKSVQVLPLSQLAAVTVHPEFLNGEGNAFCVIVSRDGIRFSGWRGGRLVMLRECPHTCGWWAIRQAVKAELGVGEDMVDELLDSNLVDPTSVMEPFLNTLFHELEFSIAYMEHRLGVKLERVFLLGLPSGGKYWSQIAERHLHTPLIIPNLFEGLIAPDRHKRAEKEISASESQAFLGALGAARAAMETTP